MSERGDAGAWQQARWGDQSTKRSGARDAEAERPAVLSGASRATQPADSPEGRREHLSAEPWHGSREGQSDES